MCASHQIEGRMNWGLGGLKPRITLCYVILNDYYVIRLRIALMLV